MDWVPTLTDRDGPLYRRIVEALTADIASGRLRRGQQLPTHRVLAKALGIDLTTVTRAYTEARQRSSPKVWRTCAMPRARRRRLIFR